MSIRGVSFFFEVAGNFSQVSKYHQCHKLFCTGFKKKKREATVAVAAVSTLKKKKQRVINSLSEKDVRQRGQERKKRDYSSEARTAQQQTFYKAATMGNSMLD